MADFINGVLVQRTSGGGGKYTDFVPQAELGIANSFRAATLDTPGIQSAMDLASASGGGIVQLPAALITLTAPLILRPNVTIQGSGWYTTNQLSTLAGGTILQGNG